MILRLGIQPFLKAEEAGPILDTRSPAEFEAGHIPGAISFPIFSNQERAIIGTLYKNEGHDRAVMEGLRIFGPQLSSVASKAKQLINGKKVRLHCWRGGLRSSSMAWLLELAGFEVTVLEGGYKAYRHLMLQTFEQPWPVLVLGGMTGSAKTACLHALRHLGEQVLDLEALACHKGSAFGTINQPPQPTAEQFENLLATALMLLKADRFIWVEDENQTIGRLVVPGALFKQMQLGQAIILETEKKDRIQRLTEEYCQVEAEVLKAAVLRIRKRLGGLATTQAINAIEQGNMEEMVEIALTYYDKAYSYQLAARPKENTLLLPVAPQEAPAETALRLREIACQLSSLN